MKTTVTFEFSESSEDKESFKITLKAIDMHLFMEDFENKVLRHFRKYDDRKAIPIDEIEKAYYELKEEYEI